MENHDAGRTSGTRTKVAVFTQDEPVEKYRKWVSVAWAGAAVALAVAVSWVVILLTTRYSDSTDAVSRLTEANAEIIEQNSDLQGQIEDLQATSLTNTETDDCYQTYTNRITTASSNFQSAALGRMLPTVLILVVQDTPGYAGEPRTIEEGVQAIADVEEYNLIYEAAVQDRTEWINNGQPLPCPVD